MVINLSITIKVEEEKNDRAIKNHILQALKQKNICVPLSEITPVFIKKSIDARHGQVKLVMRYEVYIGEKPKSDDALVPQWQKADSSKKVIIIGSGPAGLYAALRLLEDGIKPIVIERGNKADIRKKDIENITLKGELNAHSNFCYGEGGAGTFSDGKLYTRSNKRGDISKIYRIFVEFGAKKQILTDAHPHIGTDKLPEIVTNMRKKIISLGGEFYFNFVANELLTIEENGQKKVIGVKIKNTLTGEEKIINAQATILATGHSACDVYKMIAKTNSSSLEAKTFAVGVRVEHPRKIIDDIQFHGKEMAQAAEYRLTTQVDERGVYSFCMCPGGFVVPSATSKDQIVVNGMSASKRDSQWSNAAIVVETRPEDIAQEFIDQATKDGCSALAGLYWREHLEKETFNHANKQFAPAQKLTDFLNGKESDNLPSTSYKPGIVPSRLDKWLPSHICERLKKAFVDFDKSMKGFICEEAILIASETRTSTPVRILRDKETFECVGIKNLYPAGEGSGYAGGIVSSAMDGEKIANAITAIFKN